MNIDKTKTTPNPRVLIVLDDETLRMVGELAVKRSTPDRPHSRSSIIRRLIRSDYRREQRRQQLAEERQTS